MADKLWAWLVVVWSDVVLAQSLATQPEYGSYPPPDGPPPK